MLFSTSAAYGYDPGQSSDEWLSGHIFPSPGSGLLGAEGHDSFTVKEDEKGQKVPVQGV